jgi:ankyrin repeat protein
MDSSSIKYNQKTNQLNLKSFIMKKSVVVLAIALGFSISNLNATNEVLDSNPEVETLRATGVSPLCKAAATGDLEEVNRLIKAGVDVNEKSNGMMPIHYAAKYNRVDIIKALITGGSKIHQSCEQGYTALRHAQKTHAVEAENFLKRFKDKSV